MCKYCENINKTSRTMEIGDLFITQSAKYTFAGDGQEYAVPLNFCPNCGEPIALRRLISHETLVANVKRRSTGLHEDSREYSRVVLALMNDYKVTQQVAEEFIKYAKAH